MTLITRFRRWRLRRREAAHLRWMRKNRIVKTSRIEPRCIVRNIREPNR